MKKVKAIGLFFFFAFVLFQPAANAEFHHVEGCTVCHDYTLFGDPDANLRGVHDVIRMLRKRFGETPILLGGIYATLAEAHAGKHSGADMVLHWELYDQPYNYSTGQVETSYGLINHNNSSIIQSAWSDQITLQDKRTQRLHFFRLPLRGK